jgi:predicted ribosomally synthesized peptide with nif11-like leader
MSIQSARDFLAKVASDEEFRKGLSGCKNKAEQQQFAREAGFEFTSDEIGAVRDELQDADLDAISGGLGLGPCGLQDIYGCLETQTVI